MRGIAPIRILAGMLALAAVCGVATTRAQDAPRETADDAYRMAVGLHGMALHKDAAEKLQAFLVAYPQDPRIDGVQYRLGDSRVQLGQHAEALAAFQAVVDQHPASPVMAESLFRVGELNQLLGHDEKAATAYEAFLRKFEGHALAETVRAKERTVVIARLYRELEANPAQALTLTDRLATRDDAVAEQALLVRGSLLFNAGNAAEAVKACEALIARFPGSEHAEQVHLTAANAFLKLDDPKQALEHLGKITKTQMDEVLYLRGSILGRQKETEAAAQAYREVVAKHPDSRFRPYCLFELGALGQHEAWQQLARDYPKDALADEVRYREAGELAGKGQNEEALRQLQAIGDTSARRRDADVLKAELLGPSDLAGSLRTLSSLEKEAIAPARLSRTRYAVALAALDQQKPSEALKLLALVLADATCQELHPDCLYRTGLAHEQLKKTDEAKTVYRKLVDAEPKGALAPFALLRLAVLDREARPEVAMADLQRIATDFPKFEHAAQVAEVTSELQYRQAWDAFKKNDAAKAAVAFSLLKDHKAYGAEASYLAGVSFRNAGQPTEAEKHLAFLLKHHADYEFAADAREMLGELFSTQKKWQDAAQHYGAYVATIQEPAARAAVELKLGMSLYQLNQAPRAREALLYASEHGEAAVKAKALFFLGELLLLQKKHAEAKEYFLKVAVLYKHDELTPAALLEAAKCLKATGETAPCRTLLQRLATEYPTSEHAKEGGELLKELN